MRGRWELLCIRNSMTKKAFIHYLSLLLIFVPLQNLAQDIAAQLKEARQLEAGFKDNEALQKYLHILSLDANNITALCRASELYNSLGKRQPSKEKQKEYYNKSKVFAQKALNVNPNSSEANFVMALAMGRMALISSGQERINAVKEIKVFAERSVQLDSRNFKGYHLLGRWNFEVSDLSALEKWLVKLTYGALPAASLQDAIRYYEKSAQLNPGFLLNYLELAKAYTRNEESKKAVSLLYAMMKLPSTSSEDAMIRSEGKKLLEKLR